MQTNKSDSLDECKLSESQFQRLLNSIGINEFDSEHLSSKSLIPIDSKVEWIINTGASMHITASIQQLASSMAIQDLLFLSQMGSLSNWRVNLGNGFSLHNVLFIPEFDCNLISVVKLLEDLNCNVIFTSNLCLILDHPLSDWSG